MLTERGNTLVAGGQGRSGSDVWWSAVVVCVCGLSLLALAAWEVWT